MSGADYFSDDAAINPYMTQVEPINLKLAKSEHQSVQQAFERAGISVIKVDPPKACQDGIYTANWALVRGNKAILSRLPNARKAEEAYAEQTLRDLGKTVYKVPGEHKFSGQGDALICGDYLLCGSGYRSDPEAQKFAADELGLKLVQLQTVPLLGYDNQPAINEHSGWPDSFFYDIDLAISVLRSDLIAWCPEAFALASQAKINNLSIDKIEVSLAEAQQGFACNLLSTGETVIMSGRAPKLQAEVEARGLKTITPNINELIKGGGYIRCVSLTLD